MRSSVLIGVLFYLLLSSCAGSEQAQVKVGGPEEISGSDPINRYTVLVRMFIDREKGINHPQFLLRHVARFSSRTVGYSLYRLATSGG